MSERKSKGDNLPPLQKRIILNLAQNNPQTINETVGKISSHYKPSWIAFKSLEQKELIKKVDTKAYRARYYPRFWLTMEGVLVAMLEGVPASSLVDRVRTIYPENKILQYTLAMAPFINKEVFRVGISALKSKGKLEPTDMAKIMLTQMETDTSAKTIKEALQILKMYPQEHRRLKKQFSEMRVNLEKIEKMI
jgi:hypothetical protein